MIKSRLLSYLVLAFLGLGTLVYGISHYQIFRYGGQIRQELENKFENSLNDRSKTLEVKTSEIEDKIENLAKKHDEDILKVQGSLDSLSESITTKDLTASGLSNLTNLQVSGSSSFGQDVAISGDLSVSGTTSLQETAVLGLLTTQNILPRVDATYNLGSPTNKWANVYTENLSASSLSLTNLTVSGSSNFQGNIYNSVGDLVVADNLLPSANATFNLGSATYQWQEGWIDNVYTYKLIDKNNNSFYLDPNADSVVYDLNVQNTLYNTSGDVAVNDNLIVYHDLRVDTDTFSVDSTNHRVGVGTANPQVQFQVYGDPSLLGAGETLAAIGSLVDDSDGFDSGIRSNLFIGREENDYGAGVANLYAYRYGNSSDPSGGSSWALSGVDAAIIASSYYGNNYSAAIAGYSYFDYNNSAAILGGDQGGSFWGALGYYDGTTQWAGYFYGAPVYVGNDLYANNLYPNADATYDLGDSNHRFNEIYLDDGGALYVGDYNSGNYISFDNSGLFSHGSYATFIGSDNYVEIYPATDIYLLPGSNWTYSYNFGPASDSSYDLGSPSMKWFNAYIDNIYASFISHDSADLTLQTTTSGNININSAGDLNITAGSGNMYIDSNIILTDHGIQFDDSVIGGQTLIGPYGVGVSNNNSWSDQSSWLYPYQLSFDIWDSANSNFNNLSLTNNGSLDFYDQDANTTFSILNSDASYVADLQVEGDIYAGNNLYVPNNGSFGGTVSAATLTDTAGVLISGGTLNATILTDGTLTITAGNLNTSGTITAGALTDGAGASMSGGTVTGITLTDGTATLTGGALSGATTGSFSTSLTTPLITNDSSNLTLQTTTSGNIILNAAGTIELQSTTNVQGTLSATAFSGSGASLTNIPESAITDGTLLARVADNETITGSWTFRGNLSVLNTASSNTISIGDTLDTVNIVGNTMSLSSAQSISLAAYGAGGVQINGSIFSVDSVSISLAYPSGAGTITIGDADDTVKISLLKVGDASNYTQIDSQGRITQAGAARINWSKKTAASVTPNGGTHSGTVADLQTAFDTLVYQITETNTSPCLGLIVEFTDVSAFNWVNILASYNGSTSHAVTISLYNWQTGSWNTFEVIPHNPATSRTVLENHSFFVPDDSPYIGTGANAGKVRVSFAHPASGQNGHLLWIDVVALYQ